MDELIKSIIQRRNQLGWTQKVLADKTGISLSAVSRIEKGIGQWEDFISMIDSVLNKAIDEKTYFSTIKLKEKEQDYHLEDKSRKKDQWARKYDRCRKCGTTETNHIAGGLCKQCYNRATEKRHKVGNHIGKRGESSSILTKEYLVNNYVNQMKSLSDIAKDANCSRQYVHRKMLSYNIAFRDKSSARGIAFQRDKIQFERTDVEGNRSYITLKKIHVNEKFFSSWSSEMAYVLGVVYTDGYLNPGKIRSPIIHGGSQTIPSFSVAQKEPELLEKILKLMDCDAKLVFHKRREYEYTVAGELYDFRITNEIIYDDLIKLGLTPRKSLIQTFPEIPDQSVRHFIRGCWDGDGSVFIEHSEKKCRKIAAHFVSGSLKFVEGLVKCLVNAGLSETYIYGNKSETQSYNIRYRGSNVPQLFHYLYDNVPSTQYLERKFNLFKQSLEMNPAIKIMSLNPSDLDTETNK